MILIFSFNQIHKYSNNVKLIWINLSKRISKIQGKKYPSNDFSNDNLSIIKEILTLLTDIDIYQKLYNALFVEGNYNIFLNLLF